MNISKLLLLSFCLIFVSCHSSKIKVNKLVHQYDHCVDSMIHYGSEGDWTGLQSIHYQDYEYGKDSAFCKGGVGTYFNAKKVGKGSVIVLDKEEWLISKIEHADVPYRRGNPKLPASALNVRLYLKKICL